MPRSLDPSSRLTMVLACDVDKVPQPKLFAKTPTINQQRKLVTVLGSLEKGNLIESFDAILDAAALLITGWENIPIEFTRDAIGDVLSMEEIVEVISFLVSASHATADDKKKSESPHSLDVANSANHVLADAET